MKSRLTNMLLGLLIGLVISQALPVGAHGGNPGHLWKHIKSVRSSYSILASELATTKSRVSALETKTADLNTVKARVTTLESKTTKLDSFGTYTGSLSGGQILSGFVGNHRIGTPPGCSDSPARWGAFGGLWC
jgi:hypothetical protein